MLATQLSVSFVVWIAAGGLVARQRRHAGPPRYGRRAAAWLAALLFILSAALLLGGFSWIASDGGSIKFGFSIGTWLAISALGALFTVGQAEAASLVLRSLKTEAAVTTEAVDPSSSSDRSSPD